MIREFRETIAAIRDAVFIGAFVASVTMILVVTFGG